MAQADVDAAAVNAFSHLDDTGLAPEFLEMMRRLDQNPATLHLGDFAFAALAITPGERILDAGCGLGFDTQRLAHLTGPTGEVLGIDFSDAMITGARALLTAETAHISYAAGDVTALDLPDASFDVVHCERVLQHLEDPSLAVVELARVLRPGGRIALLDTDWYTATTSVGTDEEAAIVVPINATLIARSPRVGRHLVPLLRSAGLTVTGVEAVALMTDPEIVLNPPFTRLPELAEAAGLGDRALLQRWVDEAGEQARGGYLAQAVTMFGVVARKD